MHWCHNTQKKQKQLNHIPKCLQPVHAGMLTMGKMLIHVYQLDFLYLTDLTSEQLQEEQKKPVTGLNMKDQ